MSFADLELMRQSVRLEPLLQAICNFLDKQPALIERVRCDLLRGLNEPDKGRRGLTAAQVLRALILMRLKNCTRFENGFEPLGCRSAWQIVLTFTSKVAFSRAECQSGPRHCPAPKQSPDSSGHVILKDVPLP